MDFPINSKELNKLDKLKASICPYRFALESFVQEKTIFRDRFLIHIYMRMIIGYNTLMKLQGNICADNIINKVILEEYQAISDKFRLTDDLEKAQLIASVYKDVTNKSYRNSNGIFNTLTPNVIERMKLQLDLLLIKQNDIEIINDDELNNMINNANFPEKKGSHCKYCASRDICLSYKE